ncbi:helix-turn-helix domain protein [Paraburkholderia xenovorans LB400]|jgi:AraC-like DNA-binding protein|uniref:AraC family transcriptional regulator n=6 Tax=Pseudomonadota TaxID=1224 RepID=A0A024HKJ1_PSEKB|nr:MULTISPECIES: AraC family transcriptional regulator [Pseudomonadota]MBO9332235.1 helix-turn-helix domain-containing protein [Achromobacter xylosoxidans]ABE31821.1 transcriptional regulator, AraC family [Paraburkholderia xenovorans LB400]AIP31402.1 helix-turn-helix domain protein [Paraburkholderia xenovorans LB400]MDD2013177.1 AraC family transcriptional regulator [Pseudomonas putida]CAB3939944.1 hypothetical protein LMG6000_06335 [Achromobacter insolitus]
MAHLSYSPPRNFDALYRQRVFQSHQAVRMHDAAARELADHSLTWRSGNVDAALYKARARRLTLFSFRYGAEVEIAPRPSEEFIVVHHSIRGAAELSVDGQHMVLPQGRTGWMAPRRNWRMRWEAGCEQLILKIPRDMIEAGGIAPMAPLATLPAGLDTQWLLLVQVLLGASSAPTCAGEPAAWVEHIEQGLASLLRAASSCSLPRESSDRNFVARDPIARLQAMEDYMRERLGAPIGLADLSGAAGVSARVLQQTCQRHRQMSPMELLRDMRLDAVHAWLSEHPSANITETALFYGFGHLGRFAAYYRQRFGESPHQTAQRRCCALS